MNPAYQTTVFTCEGKLPSSFVIITAYNPNGKRSSPLSRNRHQDATLKSVLVSRGLTPIRVTGMSPDEAHQEPGWAVALSDAEALELGRVFKQEAIYIVREGALYLTSCAHPRRGQAREEHHLGAWLDRVRSLEAP